MNQRTRQRTATVVSAPAAALAAWGVIRLIGVDLVLSHGHDPGTVGPVDVAFAALVGGLAAWLVVLVIERRSRRPRRLWAQVGSMALGVSIIGPSSLAGGASAVALIGLHVVTAAVVITGFARTLPAPACDRAELTRGWLRNVRA